MICFLFFFQKNSCHNQLNAIHSVESIRCAYNRKWKRRQNASKWNNRENIVCAHTRCLFRYSVLVFAPTTNYCINFSCAKKAHISHTHMFTDECFYLYRISRFACSFCLYVQQGHLRCVEENSWYQTKNTDLWIEKCSTLIISIKGK